MQGIMLKRIKNTKIFWVMGGDPLKLKHSLPTITRRDPLSLMASPLKIF